eukprot:7099909-Alexandrium_andersonii.AAC.1
MSASLVGSEMCIRDRLLLLRQRTLPHPPGGKELSPPLGAGWTRSAEGEHGGVSWHQPLAPSPRAALAVSAGP